MPNLTILKGKTQTEIAFAAGSLLSEVLRSAGFEEEHPCGGRGLCGRCAVQVEGEISALNACEQKYGAHLACQTVLNGDVRVKLREKNALWQIETEGGECARVKDPMPGDYGAAVDIGTTTVAVKLFDLRTGACLGGSAAYNPQISVAADVMGRIGAAMRGQLHRMSVQIQNCICELLEDACRKANLRAQEIASLVITGNTTMLYLLTERDPKALSRAPFEADCLFGETLRVQGREILLPACMNAFVGGDITCAALAADQCKEKRIALLMDIGTNGEIALWKNGVLYVTSTAAGPAFEGVGIACGCSSVSGAIDRAEVRGGKICLHTISDAPTAGICGSGVLDVIACALELGWIDETGAMDAGKINLTENVFLTNADVRALQLAKAAIAAGLQTLLEEAQVSKEEIDTLLIAGGFGSHLNVRSAARIGLIPECLIEKTRILGNAALSGAARALLNGDDRRQLARIAECSRHVNLGGNPRFNAYYVDQMFFPEEDAL